MGARLHLAISFLALASPVSAQKTGAGLSTAPGMPLTIGHRVTTPYSPAKIPPPSPRFWLKPDSNAHFHAQALSQLLGRRTGLPSAFVRHKDYTTHADEGILITLVFSVIIQPNGSVGAVILQKRTGDEQQVYSPEAVALLVEQGQRAIKTLRFEPASTQDTLLIPLRFLL